MNETFISALARRLYPLRDAKGLDPLMELTAAAKAVLLGEASYGTKDYYLWRAEATKRLITEQGFSFIAVEADWPDCYQVNRWVKRYTDTPPTARELVRVFRRWPSWMWANEETVSFLSWLRDHNRDLPEEKRVGFYGLDLFSLWESLEGLIGHVKQKDNPEQLTRIYEAYSCFEPYGKHGAQQKEAGVSFVEASQEKEAVKLLSSLRMQSSLAGEGKEDSLSAQQNALVAKQSEKYYRAMMRADAQSWNIRDSQMAQTFEQLMKFHGRAAKGIIWAHNTHIGDARATDMAQDGLVNVGQLLRERYGEDRTVLVGFGSYQGRVMAGKTWGAPAQKMTLPPAQEGSWEELLHRTGTPSGLMVFSEKDRRDAHLKKTILHRAIGLVYHPDYEMGSYIPTVLPSRYNAFVYLDTTHSLNPVPIPPVKEEVPEKPEETGDQ